jgi:undecaprenyl diphosphate synthase
LTLNVCVSYGAREELALAVRKIVTHVQQGDISVDNINPETIGAALLTGDVPDPDLVIRTSGEKRLSNFLLFQAAYSEFIFIDKLWPAITREDFNDVLEEFSRRKRRFGK